MKLLPLGSNNALKGLLALLRYCQTGLNKNFSSSLVDSPYEYIQHLFQQRNQATWQFAMQKSGHGGKLYMDFSTEAEHDVP